ncbi:3'(2'),5'-bisphosphate nucleotidase CysQ [Mangrovibacterium diazotrophicum]|uniref:3'(2'),5'-bisphosphate nucleotidase CysQ n=1 Tax=Mangrovibacterium diazotrophicum TaxID=1261403 RepID=A0A419W5M7_9BACT|nr:3'(2'),5'-bisphosphate nucleotidase CysQ [Mangrovibacterium diazotrophicum]RKD90763.1 3'(2'),5'-bisphosphate nucleotidase [Mangrovibacterium diazotrophicum]
MQEYLSICLEAAIKAGQEIRSIYNSRHQRLQVEFKANLTPLTNADKRSHATITELLESTGLPVLSEEGENVDYDVRKNWQKFWLIDPLDGTKEFIKRNGEFTVNIALIEDCQAKLGVIYAPISGELYWGGENIGAWKANCFDCPDNLNDFLQAAQRLPLNEKSKRLRVVGSRSFKTAETQQYINELRSGNRKIEFITMGSSLKICLIAEGKADVYPRLGPSMEWDTAAGQAIVTAAGKSLTLLDHATPLQYNKQDLTNPFFIVS